MPKVSVIVPVYNVSAYIEKCCRSLFAQTLDDIELIFVNDCTPDDSVEKIINTLELFPNRQGQTRIVTMPSNGGQAAVRRQGAILAKGDYIIHCDSDDWVDLDLYETLYDKAVAENADIVVCDEIYEETRGPVTHIVPQLPDCCRDVVRDFYKQPIGMFCHNKLVRRSLYVDNDVWPWDGLNMWEDNGLMTRLFFFGGKLSQIHTSYYHYNRTNMNAMTAGYGIKQVQQMIGVANNLTHFFIDQGCFEEYKKTVYAFQFLAKINLVTDSFTNLKLFYSLFPECNKIAKELNPSAFSTKGKLRFYFVKFHAEWLFIVLFRIKNIFIR